MPHSLTAARRALTAPLRTRLIRAAALVGLGLLATTATAQDQRVNLAPILRGLAETPDSPELRFALGSALTINGDAAGGERQFRQVLTQVEPDSRREALAVQAFDRVKLSDPLSFGLIFSLMPSTNINRAASSEVFRLSNGTELDVTDGGEEKAGVGVRLGARASYRMDAGPGKLVTFGAAIDRSIYPEDRLQNWHGGLNLRWERLRARQATAVSLRVDRYVYDEVEGQRPSDNTRYSVTASHRLHFNGDRSLSTRLRLEQRRYDERDGLDGPAAELELGWAQPLSEDWSYSLGYEVATYRPEVTSSGYDGHTLKGQLNWRASRTLSLGLLAEAEVRNYRAVFPGLTEARRDEVLGLGASIRHSKVKMFGVIPRLTCMARQTQSNVALYTFDAVDCSVGITHEF